MLLNRVFLIPPCNPLFSSDVYTDTNTAGLSMKIEAQTNCRMSLGHWLVSYWKLIEKNVSPQLWFWPQKKPVGKIYRVIDSSVATYYVFPRKKALEVFVKKRFYNIHRFSGNRGGIKITFVPQFISHFVSTYVSRISIALEQCKSVCCFTLKRWKWFQELFALNKL